MTKVWRFALLGQSIAYSKSPDIFETIAKHTGTTIEFALRSIAPKELDVEVAKLVASGCDGFSLTIPFKEQISTRLDQIDVIASEIRSVNCVHCLDGRLRGYNTDVDGFLHGLKPHTKSIQNQKCLLLGTGGAGRAVLYGLLQKNLVSEVTIATRSSNSIRSLFSGDLAFDKVRTIPYESLSQLGGESFAFVVNATPLGGWNAPDTLPFPKQFRLAKDALYYDLNYNADNRAIQFAKGHGCATIDGSQMLVAQALTAFRIWTGESAPFEPIYRSVFGEAPHA